MKRYTTALIALLAVLALLAGCTQPAPETPSAPSSEVAPEVEAPLTIVKIGATAVPHAEILNQIVYSLKDEGIDLQVVEFADYTLINTALSEGQVDANFFQHVPYLDSYNEGANDTLVAAIGVHVEPLGAYSETLTGIADLPDGATIGIPNDATNEGRALLLLQSQGLITLKDATSLTAVPADVAENPKGLKFVELDASVLPRTLSETDFSIINTNYVLEAGLNPADALFVEGADSPYVNFVVVRADDANAPWVAPLKEALHSETVRVFILSTYEGAVVPAF